MNILITSAGRRVSLVRAFKNELVKLFPDAKIFAADLRPELSSACRISDKYFKVPAVNDPFYIESLLAICIDNNVKLIVPTIDTELYVLSVNADRFINNSIIPVISSPEIINICRDKRQTNQYFDSIGFPRSKEIDFNKFELPVFAKPVDGSSSIGIQLINDKIQLDEIRKNEKMMFLEYLNPVDYSEFTIDLYFDKYHDLKCAVPRERLEVRTGEVSKAVTRRDIIYELVCSKFAHCEGFVGCITLQIFRNRETDEIFGIEINPRFGGGYPLSYRAKANYPEMIIKEYMCNEQLRFFNDWSENLLMLRYDEEVIVYDYKG